MPQVTMQTHDPEIKNFMGAFKRYEPVIMDSTAMMTYKACPRMYFYRIVLGFTPKKTPEYFAFGSAYHKFREVLQRGADVEGLSVQESFLNAEEIAIAYLEKHAPSPDPTSKWSFLNIDRLRQSGLVAFRHWLEERKNGVIKVDAFEQPFSLQLGEITVAGRADNMLTWRGDPWGRDFKTSSKTGPWYARSLKPNDQFIRYTWAESKLAGKRVLGQLVEVLFNSKKEGPLIEPYSVTYSLGELNRWELEHGFWMKQIELSRQQDMYPMNEKSCYNCAYHSVCKSASESGMMSTLKTYHKIEPWDCTVSPLEE